MYELGQGSDCKEDAQTLVEPEALLIQGADIESKGSQDDDYKCYPGNPIYSASWMFISLWFCMQVGCSLDRRF